MRYLPLTPQDRRDMLRAIGVRSIDDLFAEVPQAARIAGLFDLPRAMGELEVERRLGQMATKNLAAGAAPFFLGGGTYRHHVPAAVDHLIQRGEFLTSYTPYQPEIAQGTLQYLFEFQTQVALLTGMEVANASLYDGATSCAEAVMMAGRITRRNKAVLSGGLHPHYRAVCETYARFVGFTVAAQQPAPQGGPTPRDPELVGGSRGDPDEDLIRLVDRETSCVIVQNPDFWGEIRDYSDLARACHERGALLVVVVTEIVSLGAVRPPGEMGADIVAAEGQSLGNMMNFGGPHLGLFATRESFVRQMPGRLVGETVDAEGRRGWVLTLSTREQHIRREKATSNICTNSGLCALAFTIHLALLGEAGFTRLARLNHAAAVALAERLATLPGVRVLNQNFFNEFTVALPGPAEPVVEALAGAGILAGIPLGRFHPERADLAPLLLVAATEMVTAGDMERLAAGLAEVLQ
jgi:glycine dehydrogenase subunit 1